MYNYKKYCIIKIGRTSYGVHPYILNLPVSHFLQPRLFIALEFLNAKENLITNQGTYLAFRDCPFFREATVVISYSLTKIIIKKLSLYLLKKRCSLKMMGDSDKICESRLVDYL